MRRILVRAAVLVFVAARADARTWTVGGVGADFPLIAPAIAAAAAGDVILVRGGVYRENLLLDKPLTLMGEGSPTLFGTGLGSVVTITAPGCELSGLDCDHAGLGRFRQLGPRVSANVGTSAGP